MRFLYATAFCAMIALTGCSSGGGNGNTNTIAGPTGSIEGFVYASPASRSTSNVNELAVSARPMRDGRVPVIGATIRLTDVNLTATTQTTGYFRLDQVPIGVHKVNISHAQYRDPIVTSVTVEDGKVASLSSSLGVGYYICAGIAKYPNLPAESQLLGPPNDARDMANVLFHSFYGNGVTLIDAQATKAGIKQAILDAGRKMTKDDFLIFFYSGHGASISVEGGWLDAICPEDMKLDDLTTLISDTELRDWIRQLPDPKRCVVMLDSCFSGAFFDGVASRNAGVRKLSPLQNLRALKPVECTVLSAIPFK